MFFAAGGHVSRNLVVLPVLEAVSRRTWPDDEPTLFKSRPTEGELAALASLGVIREPDLASYFRGHQEGKPALRPDLRLVAMSATLDGARFSGLMNGAQVIETGERMGQPVRQSARMPRMGVGQGRHEAGQQGQRGCTNERVVARKDFHGCSL